MICIYMTRYADIGLDNQAKFSMAQFPVRSPKVPIHLLPRASLIQARQYHHDPKSSTPSGTPNSSSSLPTTSDPDLPHLTPSQTVHMTQINEKPITKRQATATCDVHFSNSKPFSLLRRGQGTHKGDVYSVARIAGIMAAKKTPDIIPLCHPGLGITGVEVDVTLVEPKPGPEPGSGKNHGAMRVVATVGCLARTGVEMEAMTATMGAALTVYDMLKAVDKGMVIGGARLLEKTGGKSGHWVRGDGAANR